jgi:hypothetical protein
MLFPVRLANSYEVSEYVFGLISHEQCVSCLVGQDIYVVSGLVGRGIE